MATVEGGRKRSLPFLNGILPLNRKQMPTDLLAGVTLAALGIPEVMGYAKIAGMPVITGLYTILIPIAVFAILGSSRHLVVGADSATAVILAAGLVGLASVGSPQYVALAGLAALMTGVVLIVARLIRLGFLADFLSRSVLIGFLTGVGIQVAMGQVGAMFGVPSGTGGSIHKLLGTLANLGQTNMATLAVSATVLVVILGSAKINKRIPGALIAIVGAILVSWNRDLSADGVSTIGKVPGGLPSFGMPDVSWSDLAPLTATVGAIVLVVLAQSAATSRAYAAKYEEEFSENEDLVGLGVANLAAGLSGAFVVNGSPTKTQMVDGAGGRSQISQLSTAFVVLIVLLFLTGPLQYLPNAVLASVVFLIGVELVDVAGMRGIWKVRKDEFTIAAVTAAVVVVVGVEQGVILAIVLSILDYVRRGYRPNMSLMSIGKEGNLHASPVSEHTLAAPGLIVLRFAADLFYANANGFSMQVLELAGTPDVNCICLDASGIGDVDYSGWKTLKELRSTLEQREVRLVFADVQPSVRAEMDRYGISEAAGEGSFFNSVSEAIQSSEPDANS